MSTRKSWEPKSCEWREEMPRYRGKPLIARRAGLGLKNKQAWPSHSPLVGLLIPLSHPESSLGASLPPRLSADQQTTTNPPSHSRVAQLPPRLPKEEQEIFEELQKKSTGAFSTPQTAPKINQSPHSEATKTGEGEELHPDIRMGVQPEFEGEKNPKTGEVGGPKNEPLRWGAEGDWSYSGRVTDF
ncbi:hypothetical protein AWENTII_005522 [Aspergillus wentii]